MSQDAETLVFVLRQSRPEGSRRAQQERNILNARKTPAVRPEPVAG